MATIAEALALALSQRQAGNLGYAEEIYRRVLEADPDNLDARNHLEALRRPSGAGAAPEARAAPPSADALALNRQGIALANQGRYEEAAAYFERALGLQPEYPEAHSNLGNILYYQGKYHLAVLSYQQALRLKPAASVHNNLGNVLYHLGRHAEARDHCLHALRLAPNDAGTHNNLGNALKGLGRFDEAVTHYRQALQLKADYAEASHNLGTLLADRGELEEARACFQQVVHHKPQQAEAHNKLGAILYQLGRTSEAAACFRRALELKPDYAEAYSNLGSTLFDDNQLAEATRYFEHAVSLQPELASGRLNLGAVLLKQGKPGQAIVHLQEAVRLKPDAAATFHRLGLALIGEDRWSEAEATFRQVLQLEPGSARALAGLGEALARQNRLAEALACHEQALQFEPDFASAHYLRGLLLLLHGNFEEGWHEHEWHRQTFARPSYLCQPLWDGAALANRTILLYCEGGFGDYMHFIRYAHRVKEYGGTVLVHGREGVLELLASCRGVDHVLDPHSFMPSFDVQLSLYSLPTLFETRLATIPADIPYLFADPNRCHRWRQELGPLRGRGEPESPSPPYSGKRGRGEGGGVFANTSPSPPTPLPRTRGRGETSRDLKIGLAWQGNPKVSGDRTRSIPVECLAPLALEGIHLFSLQKGPAAEQLPDASFSITDLGSRLETFSDTAAIIKGLDLVISVDTSVAHCAGALGVPAWLALPLVPDWRWLLGREDSPWYPSLRLFRQQSPEQWDEVIAAMERELRVLTAMP